MSVEAIQDDLLQNLTPDQTRLLAELWARIHLLITSDLPDFQPKTLAALAEQPPSTSAKSDFAIDRSFLTDKRIVKTLEKLTPEQALHSLRNNAKHENSDTLLVRFLRARDWDLDVASIMLFTSLAWRIEYEVESKIIPTGDHIPTEGLNKHDTNVANEVLAMLSSGESFVHGVDNENRPLVYIRTKLHDPWAQGKDAFMRGCLLDVEATRMLLRPPVTCVSIVFDMTDFGLRNMDMNVLKIMASGLQNNYPECLGSIYIYNAPWMVRGIWAAVRSWLDPVVAAKVHFVNDITSLSQFIPIAKIPKYMGGEDDWEYEWIPPTSPRQFTSDELAFRDEKLQEREKLLDEYTELCRQWAALVLSEDPSASIVAKERLDKTWALTNNYWQLDQYLRGRVWIDRAGLLKPDGTCNL